MLLGCAVLGAAGQQQLPLEPAPDRDTAQAELSLRANGIAETLARYRALVAAHPNDPQALTALGVLLYGERQPEAVIPLLTHALDVNPLAPRAGLFLALSRSAIEQCDRAVPDLTKYFAAEPAGKLQRLTGLTLLGCLLQSDAAGDYDHDGALDILKTNFSDEVPNLYHNDGKASFNDADLDAGLSQRTHYVGWGCGFFDPDNDGWLDILYCNGHVYPELDRIHADTAFREPCVLYRNEGNGHFEDVSALAGSALSRPATGRGCAFGDFNNDGCPDVVINNQGGRPSLLRFEAHNRHGWINLRLVGTRSNRSAIGARVRCMAGALAQVAEVQSCGSYLSRSDLRLHFGLGEATVVDLLEISGPSGAVDRLHALPANQFLRIEEGGKVTTLLCKGR